MGGKKINGERANKEKGNTNMRIAIKIFLGIIFIFFLACKDQGLIVKCPDCLAEEPTKAIINVKLDLASVGYETIIKVYEGNIEDSIIYDSFKTTSSSATISVTLNKKYTVTATYYISDNYYVAIDSATPRVKFEKSQCDNPCYFIYDKNIDLRLKYTR